MDHGYDVDRVTYSDGGEVCAREGSVQKIRPIQNLNNINTYRSIASNNVAEKKKTGGGVSWPWYYFVTRLGNQFSLLVKIIKILKLQRKTDWLAGSKRNCHKCMF